MKAPEPMKNLWMKSACGADGVFSHKHALSSSVFIPIYNVGQPVDRRTHFQVIPFPRVSY